MGMEYSKMQFRFPRACGDRPSIDDSSLAEVKVPPRMRG